MISLIIPTLNEEHHLSRLLTDVIDHPLISQIIVVDGGSTDDTVSVAKSFGVELYESARGRAVQMNLGTSKATNNILLFIHADSKIEKAAIESIPEILKTVDAGSFYLAFDKKGYMLNLFSRMSRINSSLFTYGDQGLFIRKSFFEKIGGFTDMPIMEDLDIIRRIKRNGSFFKIQTPITTSARRFERNGVLYQQFKNIVLVALFLIGVSPWKLSRFYNY